MDDIKIIKWEEKMKYDSISGFCMKKNDGPSLDVLLMSNRDLYITLNNCINKQYFIIDVNNYEIYEIFDRLYKEIITGDVFPQSNDDIDEIVYLCEMFDEDYHNDLKIYVMKKEIEKEKYKDISIRTGLVKNNKIIWKSDDYKYEIAPFFVIEKNDEAYKISFKKSKIENNRLNDVISVRIRNINSRYKDFNYCFVRMFNSVMNLDINNYYHQMRIDEYQSFDDKKIFIKKQYR